MIRWPDDGPQLIERYWDRIGPCLDAITEQSGARRLSPDEAAALPGLPMIATTLALLDPADPRARLLVGEPAAIAGYLGSISSLAYGQRRVLPMPLDVLASLNRKLRPVAALGSALAPAQALLGRLRAREGWAGLVGVPGERGRRATRHLALTGVPLLQEGVGIDEALSEAGSHPHPAWLEVTACEDGYELLVRVPGLCKDTTVLSRAGDDLVITVDGIAHPVELPSGLKRCAVVGGSVRADGLRIRFRPERGKWRD